MDRALVFVSFFAFFTTPINKIQIPFLSLRALQNVWQTFKAESYERRGVEAMEWQWILKEIDIGEIQAFLMARKAVSGSQPLEYCGQDFLSFFSFPK